jgi:Stabilization of polarity axis
MIQLIQTFSNATISGPHHPHLHTNGNLTHPIILLFNALITGKRIIFLGHSKPAGQISSYVLSACALGSGCGVVLKGFIERAFPYANLTNREEWESMCVYLGFFSYCTHCSSSRYAILVKTGLYRRCYEPYLRVLRLMGSPV